MSIFSEDHIKEPLALPLLFAPSISFMVELHKHKEHLIYTGEQYGKQSYRNRADFIGAEGAFSLTIPVAKYGYPAPPFFQIIISDHNHWPERHFRALQSAYGSSPFWIHYEDHIIELFKISDKENNSLEAFNTRWLHFLCEELGIKRPQIHRELPEGYQFNTEIASRHFKEKSDKWPRYWQVFEERYGFVSDLSSLDLLLNLGPEGALYLDHCTQL